MFWFVIGVPGGDETGTDTFAVSESMGQTEDSFDEVDAGMDMTKEKVQPRIKAKISEISSDKHPLQLIKKFKLIDLVNSW